MIETAAPPYVVTPQVLIVADDPRAAQLVSEAAVLAGGRIEATLGWSAITDELAAHRAIDVIAVEAVGVGPDIVIGGLVLLDGVARERGARIVVTLAEDQIDLVAATIFGAHVQLLCLPSVAERVIALTIAARVRVGDWARESGRDADEGRLRRLNEEVARIAETLSRLTRGEVGVPERPAPAVGDRTSGYGAAPPPGEAMIGAADVRNAIRARRLRSQFFDEVLFEDPAWDMLLDLFAAELEHAQVSVSSLCIGRGGRADHRAALDRQDDRSRAVRAAARSVRPPPRLHDPVAQGARRDARLLHRCAARGTGDCVTETGKSCSIGKRRYYASARGKGD